MNLLRTCSLLLLSTSPFAYADFNSGSAAMARKDYATAWRELQPCAQQGDPNCEAALGGMIEQRLNPPGTGYPAQAENWYRASANQGNPHGEALLGMWLYHRARQMNSGINPGVNDYVPPARHAQAETMLTESRGWLEKAAAGGDGFAMGNLAILLDAGIGGPVDHARAVQLRNGISSQNSEAGFRNRVTASSAQDTVAAQWQQGHYQQALSAAYTRAQQGDPVSLALLGKAYYLGVGVPRNYATALIYLNKAADKSNPDAIYILGLMYEHGRGVPQQIERSVKLFDRAAALGQGYAKAEVAGMRMQGESNRVVAQMHGTEDAACGVAGGVSTPGGCIKTGVGTIDPWSPESQ